MKKHFEKLTIYPAVNNSNSLHSGKPYIQAWNKLNFQSAGHRTAYCRICICIIGLILIITAHVNSTVPSGLPEPEYAAEKAINNEIIILLNKEADEQVLSELCGIPYEITIIEYQSEYILAATDALSADECISYLNSLDIVLIAEPNQEITISSLPEPINYAHQIKPQQISINASSRNEVIVAVLDTGIDYSHPDIKPYMWINKGEIDSNGYDDDSNGYIDDIYGWDFYNNDASVCHYAKDKNSVQTTDLNDNDNHGTHCAGIIIAASEAEINNIKIMALKIHGGRDGKGSIANAIKAVKYACMMGADICNMSWGTSIYSEALEQVMRESDMLFITASGNEGRDIENYPIYPACFELDNMIAAAFTDDNGRIAYDSNYSSKYVDIGAKGVDINSTIVGSYGIMKGSSMAAPYTAGIAAILYAGERNVCPYDVKQVLLGALIPSPANEGYVAYPGILDPSAVLKHKSLLLKDILPPKLDIETTYKNEILLLLLTASDTGGSGVRVIKYASGTKQISDFKRGTAGTSIRSDQLKLTKSGQYTFYISDYSGNEAIYYYLVKDDTEPPVISASFSQASGKKFYTITADVSDDKSSVKLVKYMKGEKKAEDFRSASQGTVVELNNSGNYTIDVELPGTYTIYALDNRGNSSVYTLEIPKITTALIQGLIKRFHNFLSLDTNIEPNMPISVPLIRPPINKNGR